MQINSITNNFNTNTQNRNYFSKNESHVAFGSREEVLGYTSKIALKHINEKNLYKAKVKNIIKDAIKNSDVKILFEAVGLKAKRDLFGKYTVSGYGKGGGATHDFSELGVDENKLLKKIKRITGTADFRESNATDLGSLKQIDGDLWLSYDKRTPQWGYFDFITHNGKTKHFHSKPRIPVPYTTSNLDYPPSYYDHEWKPRPEDYRPYTTSSLDYPPSYHDHDWKPCPEDYRPFTTSNLDYPPNYYDHEWKPRPEDYRPSIFF